MSDRQVTEVMIANIEPQYIGTIKQTEHFFYGSNGALRKLRTKIKSKYPKAQFELEEGSMTVTIEARVDAEDLDELYDDLSACVGEAAIEYDGYGVSLCDLGPRKKRFEAFEKYIKPGECFAFALPNGCFGHGIFIGGSALDGHIFDFSRLISKTPATPDAINHAQSLYRQPVLGLLDPKIVIALGAPQEKASYPVMINFRVPFGVPALPEEIDAFGHKLGLAEASSDANFLEFCQRLQQAGMRLPNSDDSDKYVLETATINRDGKISWAPHSGKLYDFTVHHDKLPFLTVYASIENITEALVGSVDELDLLDKVS